MIYFFVSTFLLLLFFKNFLKKKQKAQKQISFALKSKRFFILKSEYNTLKKDISNKLNFNISNKFNQKIDFLALTNANLFENKEIFKIVVNKTNFWKKEFLTFKSLKESKNFSLVFQVKNHKEEQNVECFLQKYNFKNFKIINLADINFKLLFEINKLNVNYPPQIYLKPEHLVENKTIIPKLKNFCSQADENCQNFVCKFESCVNLKNSNIFAFDAKKIISFNLKAKNKVNLIVQTYIKLNTCFVTFKVNKNEISIFDENNLKKYYSSQIIEKVSITKYEGQYFLVINFKRISLLKNQTKEVFLSEDKIDFYNIGNLKLKSFLNFKSATNFNFLSKNEFLNTFFNKKLPFLIKKMVFNSSYTFKYQNFKFKNLSSIKVFFEKFLGLKIEENVLEIHPKFEFSINLNGLKIETKSGEENSVGINGVKFVNLNKIDLSLLTEKNLTFVYKKVL